MHSGRHFTVLWAWALYDTAVGCSILQLLAGLAVCLEGGWVPVGAESWEEAGSERVAVRSGTVGWLTGRLDATPWGALLTNRGARSLSCASHQVGCPAGTLDAWGMGPACCVAGQPRGSSRWGAGLVLFLRPSHQVSCGLKKYLRALSFPILPPLELKITSASIVSFIFL